MMVGTHVIKGWSSTQEVIALSSGEAELYGLVKGATHGIGMKSLALDMGIQANIDIVCCTDASAAKGIASRRGAGEVRHIEVNQLWIQGKGGYWGGQRVQDKRESQSG